VARPCWILTSFLAPPRNPDAISGRRPRQRPRPRETPSSHRRHLAGAKSARPLHTVTIGAAQRLHSGRIT